MKNKIITIFAIAILAAPAFAQLGSQSIPELNLDDTNITDAEISMVTNDFSSAGILPDHMFYFIKKITEGMTLFFSSPADKAKLHMAFASERLAEAGEMISLNKSSLAMSSLNQYSSELDDFEKESNMTGVPNASIFLMEKGELFLTMKLRSSDNEIKTAIKKALDKCIKKKAKIQDIYENGSAINENASDKNMAIRSGLDKKFSLLNSRLEKNDEQLSKLKKILNNTNSTTRKLIDQAEQMQKNAKDALDKSSLSSASENCNAAEHLTKEAQKIIGK
jgi:hypothetical protein